MIQTLPIMIFGHFCKLRILQSQVNRFALTSSQENFIFFVFLIIDIGIFVFLYPSPLLVLIAVLASCILPHGLPLFLEQWIEAHYRKSILALLENTLLGMCSGKAFRAAVRESAIGPCNVFEKNLFNLVDCLLLGHSAYPAQLGLLKDFFQELKEIDSSNNRIKEKLTSLRDFKRSQEQFRQKSRRATEQIRIQAQVMIVLYLLLLIIVLYYFGLNQSITGIFWSFILFSAGVYVNLSKWGRLKWKT